MFKAKAVVTTTDEEGYVGDISEAVVMCRSPKQACETAIARAEKCSFGIKSYLTLILNNDVIFEDAVYESFLLA